MQHDPSPHPHGGALVADALREWGVDHLFTLCGGHISPILVAAKARGIRVVDCRDERSAVFAADAAARLSGNLGVAAVTAGPGVTNAVTALKNAQMAESPLLLLGGATGTLLKGRGALQDIDQLSIVAPLTKWAHAVRLRSDIGPVLHEAAARAREGVPGPVFVELPVDLLYPEEIVVEQYLRESGARNATNWPSRLLGLGLRAYLARQFHQPHLPGFTEVRRRWFPKPPPEATEEQLERAARMLRGAERPVLLVGHQALLLDREPHTLAEAVTRIGAPTYLAGMARGLLGPRSSIQFRHKRREALRRADVVLVAGFPFDFRLGYGRTISSKAAVIAVHLDAATLRRNRRPELPIQAHPGHFLRLLAERMEAPPDRWRPWFDELREREAAREAEIERMAAQPCEGGVNPIRLCQRIEAAMDERAIVVADGGDFVATAAYVLHPRGPLRWLDPGVFGTLGVGGGFAVGASALRPGDPVWLLWGDGSSAFSLAEMDSCVRHGFAPIAVVGNDGCWMQIAREQVPMLGDEVGTTLRRTDYEKVAEGYGAAGLRIERDEDIDEALAEARRLAGTGRPVVINAHIGRTDFRKGSISM